MPPLPNVPKVIKCALRFSDGVNTDVITRFYLRYSGSAPSSLELTEYAGTIRAEFSADLAGDLNEALSLIEVELIDLSSATAAQGTDATEVPGTATDDPVPLDAAVVSSYQIARRYRGGHPRGYWPLGQATNLQTPQTWTSAFIAALHTSLNTFFTNVRTGGPGGSGTITHVNVSYFAGFTVVTDPVTGRARNVPTVRATPVVDEVTSRIERIRIGTQRRRLQY